MKKTIKKALIEVGFLGIESQIDLVNEEYSMFLGTMPIYIIIMCKEEELNKLEKDYKEIINKFSGNKENFSSWIKEKVKGECEN